MLITKEVANIRYAESARLGEACVVKTKLVEEDSMSATFFHALHSKVARNDPTQTSTHAQADDKLLTSGVVTIACADRSSRATLLPLPSFVRQACRSLEPTAKNKKKLCIGGPKHQSKHQTRVQNYTFRAHSDMVDAAGKRATRLLCSFSRRRFFAAMHGLGLL
jgi:hypothetical protein